MIEEAGMGEQLLDNPFWLANFCAVFSDLGEGPSGVMAGLTTPTP
jgi:hypothetical protein